MVYLTLLTALTIAGVAAWYSIIGLMTIFAGAAIPIAIMGGTLEIGKLVTASWLHQNWDRAPILMKSYLTISVATLMVITSLGIFGFLSKAHVEQIGETAQASAKVERIDDKIARYNGRIQVTRDKIDRIESADTASGAMQDNTINRGITRQEEIIDSAWERISEAIKREESQMDRLRDQLDSDIKVQQDRIGVAQTRVQEDVLVKERSIERVREEIKGLDQDVRALTDKGVEKGTFGNVIKDWIEEGNKLRQSQQPRRDQLAQQISDIGAEIDRLRAIEIEISKDVQNEITSLRSGLVASLLPHRDKIEELRLGAQTDIDEANAEIKRLRGELGVKEDTAEVKVIDLEKEIDSYFAEIDLLREEKFTLESGVRDLEAEVGPLKYIAELIYGDEAKEHFDEAVRWVIILLIVTFDPLAIVLLLAANMGFSDRRKSKMFYDDGNLRVDPSKVADVEEILDIPEYRPDFGTDSDEIVDVTADIPSDEDMHEYEVVKMGSPEDALEEIVRNDGKSGQWNQKI